MRSLFKASLPFFEPPPVGCLGLMDFTVIRVFVTQGLAPGFGVRGHFHVAYLLPAVTYFLFRFVKDGILTMTINPVNEAFAIVRLGKLRRGFVQMFLATPFHVRILTRKSIQHQEKKTQKSLKNRINKNTPIGNRGLLAGGTGVSLNLLSELRGPMLIKVLSGLPM